MHPCPLRSLQIVNFKSIAHARVEFKPLTVLVGMNSSGKSSLLQSIRFLSQTATTHETGIEVPLNGTKTKLGTFDDVRTVGTDGPISFQANLATVTRAGHNSDDVGSEARLMLEIVQPQASPERGYARITVNHLEVSDAAVLACAEYWLRAIWDEFVDRPFQLDWNDQDAAIDLTDLFFEGWWADESRLLPKLAEMYGSECAYDLESGSFIGLGVQDIRKAFAGIGMPTLEEFMEESRRIIDKAKENESWCVEQLTDLIKSVHGNLEADDRADFITLIRAAVSLSNMESTGEAEKRLQRISEHLDKWFYEHLEDASDQVMPSSSCSISLSRDDVGRLIKKIQGRARYHQRDRRAGGAIGLTLAEEVGLRFKEPDNYPYSPDIVPAGDLLQVARLFLQACRDDAWKEDRVLKEWANQEICGPWRPAVGELLRERVRYLGPLRQAPRPYFDFADENRPDVGAAGEHLSRVLQWHGTKSVDVPGLGQADLTDGLQHWLRELGVVDDVAVEARGRAGVSIEVRPPDLNRQVDLTSVGVGVSQVLPVLAVCLLAEPGDIVLLEQPELHLHPALQMRLADFFLACAESGRQIVVETHSEHLVNRLRRRVAEDDGNDVAKLARIVFAERDAEGHTTFRASDINPLGGLSEDWPDGFLDLGARDAQKLLQAGLAKHRLSTN